MTNEIVTNIRLTIKADNRTYFNTNHINPFASDTMLNEFADAVNSVQNMPLDKVIKNVQSLLVQS
jgi:hypothetical protein